MNIDWSEVLLPNVPILEILVRGTLTYLGIFILLRVILKRETSGISTTDVLVIVLLADASQNAMAGGYKSVADGLLLVTVILFWSFAIDWLGYHSKLIHHFVSPPPVTLYENGQLKRKNLRRQLITHAELMDEIRQAGYQGLENVKAVYMEGDGLISVIGEEGEKSKKTPLLKAGVGAARQDKTERDRQRLPVSSSKCATASSASRCSARGCAAAHLRRSAARKRFDPARRCGRSGG